MLYWKERERPAERGSRGRKDGKMVKRVLAVLTAAAVLLGAGTVSAAVKAAPKETAQVKDAGQELEFSGENGILYKKKGDSRVFCDPAGKEFPELIFSSVGIWTGEVAELRRQGAETPESCIVRTDGTVLVPWALMVVKAKNDRFLEITFADEKTDNKEEAMMYLTSKMFTISPGEDDVLFKGHQQLLDLQTGKLLDAFVATNTRQSFETCGDSYRVYDGSTWKIYAADGTVLADDASGINVSGSFYYSYDHSGQNRKLIVYDSALKQVSESEKASSLLSGGLFSFKGDNDLQGVLSLDGKEMVPAVSEYMPKVLKGGLIQTGKKAGDRSCYGLYDASGKQVLDMKYENISEMDEGYLYAKEADKKFWLLDPKGRVISDSLSSYPSLVNRDEGDGKSYLNLANGQYIDFGEKARVSRIGPGVVSVCDGNTQKYGVWDLKTGEQILKYEWDYAGSAYGSIYALKGDTWHVFPY